jgi:glutamate N-acetyltransferase / amino-acid N-acetyltransferase
MMIKLIDGGICAPKGFLANGIHVGIRKNPNKLDLALIYSEAPADSAGVFTTNKAKAAPVILTQKHLKNGKIQAIIVNSGNANACTGEIGFLHANQMANKTASKLKLTPNLIGIASTGVIGVTLPIDKILNGIDILTQDIPQNSIAASQAIMTTDTFPKSIAIELNICGKKVCIGGMAKGSGMIHPNMATMLGFITTDISISQEILQYTLTKVNNDTFNMITVDGETSTNDMVLLISNGMAKNPEINSIHDPDWNIFFEGLSYVCQYLSKEIARDGEGATKLIEVQVNNAITNEQAKIAARTICSSPLVKSAIYGEDANWGRIVNALGYSGIDLSLRSLSVSLGSLCLFQDGEAINFSEMEAKEILKQKTVMIHVNLGLGNENATAWGCDLTHDYVNINASYRT